jgi:multidrug transporter EmrE-like cation transporter
MDGNSHLRMLMAMFLNVWVIAGLALYFSAAVVWLFALARIEVSMAYPFVGLGFILTMILGKFLMGDAVTAARLVGTLLISIGVVLVARG